MEDNEFDWEWLTSHVGNKTSWPPRYYSAVTTNPWTYSETSFPGQLPTPKGVGL